MTAIYILLGLAAYIVLIILTLQLFKVGGRHERRSKER